MIDLTARRSVGASRTLKIIGVGGGGCNALDRMVLDGVNPSHLVALHTDVQTLTACVAGEKIELGQGITRGFGAGGDPELGRQAAQESAHAIQRALDGNDAIFIVGGLGGGTGSGAIPLVAQWAKEAGALVIAVVTLPFTFEGKRRQSQADEALAALNVYADAIICFENDRMSESVPPNAPISHAFTVTDHTLSQAVQATCALFYRKGYIHIGFDELKAVLGGRSCSVRTLFGYGEATGDNRAFDALKKAFKHPLLDKGRGLRECTTILVQVSGGPDMLLSEVQLLMEEFHREVNWQTRILFGTAVDNALAGKMVVTLFGSTALPGVVEVFEPAAAASLSAPVNTAELEAEEELVRFDQPQPVEAVEPAPSVLESVPEEEVAELEEEELIRFDAPAAEVPEEIQELPVAGEDVPEQAEEEEQPSLFSQDNQPRRMHQQAAPVVPEASEAPGERPAYAPGRRSPFPPTSPYSTRSRLESLMKRKPVASVDEPVPVAAPTHPQQPAPAKVPQQETLKFETANRGRFEKSEPTIIDGQDLDIPTYLRRNIRLR